MKCLCVILVLSALFFYALCHDFGVSYCIPLVGFLLHGSADPLTARLGGAVLLPCFADRPLPLEGLQVEWRRTDTDTIVHLFLGGQSRPESQGDAYRGRAHLLPQEIPKGNFSLLLEDVRTADTGVYECVVYREQERRETRVRIQEVGKSPSVSRPKTHGIVSLLLMSGVFHSVGVSGGKFSCFVEIKIHLVVLCKCFI
uniref:Ig-like domain-containing protein n=1 Tax=Paramormyrops kingsleyae TaxID=1676925 RepID=A0A3B3SKG8_9TELE